MFLPNGPAYLKILIIFRNLYFTGCFSLSFDVFYSSSISLPSCYSLEGSSSIVGFLFSPFLCWLLWLFILPLHVNNSSSFNFTNYTLHSSPTFSIPIFQDVLCLFSSYFFKSPINLIEVFIGLNSSYSPYHIHYFASFQLIIFFVLRSLILVLCAVNWW